MSYVTRIEAATFKPAKPTSGNISSKPVGPQKPVGFQIKPEKELEGPKAKPAHAEKNLPKTFARTIQKLPAIQDALKDTDPFHFNNETWTKFFKEQGPTIMANLMVDLHVFPAERLYLLKKFFNGRIK